MIRDGIRGRDYCDQTNLKGFCRNNTGGGLTKVTLLEAVGKKNRVALLDMPAPPIGRI